MLAMQRNSPYSSLPCQQQQQLQQPLPYHASSKTSPPLAALPNFPSGYYDYSSSSSIPQSTISSASFAGYHNYGYTPGASSLSSSYYSPSTATQCQQQLQRLSAASFPTGAGTCIKYPATSSMSNYPVTADGLSYGVESPSDESPNSPIPCSPQQSPSPNSYSPPLSSGENPTAGLYNDSSSTSSPPSTSPVYYSTSSYSSYYSSLPMSSNVSCSSSSIESSSNSYHYSSMSSADLSSPSSSSSSSCYASNAATPAGTASMPFSYAACNYPTNTTTGYFASSYPLPGGTDYSTYPHSTAFGLANSSSLTLWNYPSFQVSPVSKVSYDSPRYKLTPERAIPLIKWFEEHKEHPYPSRHEKMVLCQSTQLTFTQVSTWFANARRRMKKAAQDEEEMEEEDGTDDQLTPVEILKTE